LGIKYETTSKRQKTEDNEKRSPTQTSRRTQPTLNPTATSSADPETAAILTALISRPDDYKIVFNDNRLVFKGTPSGDRNVIITVISDTNDAKVNTDVGLKILQLVGNALEPIDVDYVAVDVRQGNKETNMTSAYLSFKKKDVQEYSAGHLSKAEMLTRQARYGE